MVRIQDRLHCVHNTRLFAVLIPSPNLGKYFCTHVRTRLQQSARTLLGRSDRFTSLNGAFYSIVNSLLFDVCIKILCVLQPVR